MRKGSLLILITLSIAALLVWFSCNPFQAQNNSSTPTFNVLDNSDTVRASAGCPTGFAAGVTGGLGGTVVKVSTLADLTTYAAASGSYIVNLGGATINGGGAKIMIASNHTIANGILTECELAMQKGVTNIVIRNMKISFNDQCSDKDLIHLETAVTNVWVDHCELFDDTTHGKDYYDGALDITHGCDNITVSNIYAHDHYKVSLVGHSDSNGSEDTGKLHVTYFNNWFDNIDARSPLLRFGTAHIFNNYMSNYFDAATGCNIRMGAKARIEGNVFENCANPILSVDSTSIGYWDLGPAGVDTNTYTGATWVTGSPASSSQTNASLNSFADTCSYTPPYSYTLMAASAVKAYVQANAGYGKVDGTVY